MQQLPRFIFNTVCLVKLFTDNKLKNINMKPTGKYNPLGEEIMQVERHDYESKSGLLFLYEDRILTKGK